MVKGYGDMAWGSDAYGSPSTPLRTKIAALLAKEEATYNTDPVPTVGSNGIVVISDLSIAPAGDTFTRSPFDITLSQRSANIGAGWFEISFITELHSSGVKDSAPRIGDLFEACGMLETVNSNTSVVYTPATSSLKSCTMYIYIDGIRHVFTGCVGTWRMMIVVGETAKIEWRFFGKYAVPTDVAVPSSVTYDSPVPPSIVSASFLFDSTAFKVQQLEIDLGAVFATRKDLSEATGVCGFTTVSREPKGTFNPESILLATYDFFTLWRAATQKALTITIGDTSGNQWNISLPKVVLDTPAYADRDGIRTFELPFICSRNSGNDEISLSQV